MNLTPNLEGGVRTHKSDLETKLKTTVRNGHPCMSWMVENVADTIDKFKIGYDSRAAFARPNVTNEFGSVALHQI